MDDLQEKNTSENAQPQSPVKSKTTALQATIDRQAKQKIEQPIVHRYSNAHSEPEGPKGKWCSGDNLLSTECGSVLDEDVTCPDCLKVIAEKKAAADIVAGRDPEPEPDAQGVAPDVTKQMQEKLAASAEPEPDKSGAEAQALLDNLKDQRQRAFELQTMEVDVLSDIAATINNISDTLKAMCEFQKSLVGEKDG